MTRTYRTRSKPIAYTDHGKVVVYWPYPTIFQTHLVGPHPLSYDWMEDYVGAPWTDSKLTINSGRSPDFYVWGWREAPGPVYYQPQDCPLHTNIALQCHNPWQYWLGLPAMRSISELSAQARANANPNRPVLDLPVSILELREIPGLLRDAGRLAIWAKRTGRKIPTGKGAAKVNVIAQFGILPIIRDILTLLRFSEAVDNRERYLRNLASEKPFVVNRSLGEDTSVHYKNGQVGFDAIVDPDLSTNKVDVKLTLTRKYWYSARIKLIDPPDEHEMRSAAFKVALGTYDFSIEAAWQLLPWSWLVDYFFTVGDLLAANRGGLDWKYSDINLMCLSTYDTSVTVPNPRQYYSYGNWGGRPATTKWRRQSSGLSFPTLKVPYLSWSQWSILASLFTIKLL